MKFQFEADGSRNVLWAEVDGVRIVATVDLVDGCSEDFGYLTMKDEILRRFPQDAKNFEFCYDGQEQNLFEDARADVEVDIDYLSDED